MAEAGEFREDDVLGLVLVLCCPNHRKRPLEQAGLVEQADRRRLAAVVSKTGDVPGRTGSFEILGRGGTTDLDGVALLGEAAVARLRRTDERTEHGEDVDVLGEAQTGGIGLDRADRQVDLDVWLDQAPVNPSPRVEVRGQRVDHHSRVAVVALEQAQVAELLVVDVEYPDLDRLRGHAGPRCRQRDRLGRRR